MRTYGILLLSFLLVLSFQRNSLNERNPGACAMSFGCDNFTGFCHIRPVSVIERFPDEMVQALSGDGKRTGRLVGKKDAHRDGTPHESSGNYIFDSSGQYVLLQVRSRYRFTPGALSVSISGHFREYETPDAARDREAREEFEKYAGFALDRSRYTQIGETGSHFGFYDLYEINYRGKSYQFFIFTKRDQSGQEYPILRPKGDIPGELLDSLKSELGTAGNTAMEKVENFRGKHNKDLIGRNREFKTLSVYVLSPQEEAMLDLGRINRTLSENAIAAAHDQSIEKPESEGFQWVKFDEYVRLYREDDPRFAGGDSHEPYISDPKTVEMIRKAVQESAGMRPEKKSILGLPDEVKKIVIDNFNRFINPGGVAARMDNCTVKRVIGGLVNKTYLVVMYGEGEEADRTFVVHELASVFDRQAMNNNLRVLQVAQGVARLRGILPAYWQDAAYLDVAGSPEDTNERTYRVMDRDWTVRDKIITDPESGMAWRVMRYVKGDFFESYDDISDPRVPKKGDFSRVTAAQAATAQGAALATFGAMLDCVKEDIAAGRLPEWQYPLRGFHNTQYHLDYLDAILRDEFDPVLEAPRKRIIRLSLKQSREGGQNMPDTQPVSPDDRFAVSRDDALIASYPNGLSRVNTLAQKIRDHAWLAGALDNVGTGMNNNDGNLNNFAWESGVVSCIVDLDTIQSGRGRALDDIGDTLRSSGNKTGEEPQDDIEKFGIGNGAFENRVVEGSGIKKVQIDKAIIVNIVKGYVERMKGLSPDLDSGLLAQHAITAMKIFCLELSSRYLADALTGNRYFALESNVKKFRADANLYRAEVQMKVLELVETAEEEIVDLLHQALGIGADGAGRMRGGLLDSALQSGV